MKMLAKKIKAGLGIITKKVLTGPIEVSLDLTCRCTTGCVMCWYWSPWLKEQPDNQWSNQSLDYEVVRRLITDFKKMEVKRIILGGQGDPLLYPRLLEVIEEIKRSRMEVCLITGGVYLDAAKTKALFDLGLDHLDISLQAASEETYAKIHPLQKEGTFERIKEQLLYLLRLKQEVRSAKPQVRIIQVVCKLNYQETVSVVELARETGAQSIGFKRIDVVPETRQLLLNEEQLKELEVLLAVAEKRALESGVKTEIPNFRKHMLAGLMTGVYTEDFYAQIPCYVGWHSSRILANGEVTPCCGCYNLIFGNINRVPFNRIWNSDSYQQFRLRALGLNKNLLIKQGCKCFSCIDYNANLGIYLKLHPFRIKEG